MPARSDPRTTSSPAKPPSPPRPPAAIALVAIAVACAPARPANGPSAADAPRSAAAAEPTAAAHQHGASGGHQHGAHDSSEHGYAMNFSDAEAFSSHFDDPSRDAWQQPEAVLDLMKIEPASTVVDLGAGTGYFVARLAARVGAQGKVLALDVEPKMVESLNRRVQEEKLGNVQPRLVATDDPGLAPSSVSRVLIVNTWHHIDQRPSYAKKLAGALAARGEVWIVDFTLESEDGPPAQYRLSAAQVVRELEQGGLRAQVVEPEPLPNQYIVRASR